MANEPKNLYDLTDFFRLTRAGIVVYDNEPIGWDKVQIKFQREKELFGLNYEFADETVSLIFPFNTEGGKIIEEAYEAEGADADVLFEYGFYQGGVEKVQFRGKMNFNDKVQTDEGYQITIRKDFFEALIRTRFETKVSMVADEDLDGNAIAPPVPKKIKLHSKKIKKYGEATYDSSITPSGAVGVFIANAKAFLQPETGNLLKAEVETVNAMPLTVSTLNPQSESRFQFGPIEQGRVKLVFEAEYEISISAVPWQNFFGIIQLDDIDNYSFIPYIEIYRNGSLLSTCQPATEVKSGSTGNTSLSWTSHSFRLETWADLLLNDEVYMNVKVSTGGNHERTYRIRNWKGTIAILQETSADPSTCLGYTVFQALNHVVAAITGKVNAVRSEFFGPGGCGEKYLLTNGFKLRGFDGRAVNLSFKDLVEGDHPIWNLGFQYSSEAGNDIIIIEPAEKLFSGGKILDLDPRKVDFNSWEDEHSKDFTFNEAEFGYMEFAEDAINSLDEFNTNSISLLPIKTFKGKYEKKSKFIASGYMIEAVRREQFKTNPSSSLSTDEKIFIIAFIEERLHENVSFTATGSSIEFSKPVNLLPGETVKVLKVGGGANDATTFEIMARDYSALEKYIVNPAPVADNGLALIEIPIDMPEAEKNEPFAQVDNLISPETAYNLRISPKRIMQNHGTVLNIGLAKKADDELIKNTWFKSNGELITRFNDSEPCMMIDSNVAIQEDADIALLQLQSRRKLFLPEMVKFKMDIDYDKVILMAEAARGMTGTDKDFGFVVFMDIKGKYWEGFVWEMNYDPANKQAQFLIRKKRMIS
jgi:hypothetical protein